MDDRDKCVKDFEKLTKELPSLGDIVRSEARGVTRYEVDAGSAHAYGLLKIKSVAVAHAFFSKGTTLRKHVHGEHTHLIIESGGLRVTLLREGGDDVLEAGVGEAVYVPPNVGHIVESPVLDTWFVSISVPAAEGYPDV